MVRPFQWEMESLAAEDQQQNRPAELLSPSRGRRKQAKPQRKNGKSRLNIILSITQFNIIYHIFYCRLSIVLSDYTQWCLFFIHFYYDAYVYIDHTLDGPRLLGPLCFLTLFEAPRGRSHGRRWHVLLPGNMAAATTTHVWRHPLTLRVHLFFFLFPLHV